MTLTALVLTTATEKGLCQLELGASNSPVPLTGRGYKITHLYINRPSNNNVGLFGYTGSGSEIKDEGLEEIDGACSSHGKERR